MLYYPARSIHILCLKNLPNQKSLLKKRYRINKALYEKIKKNIAQINSLIPNPKVLK
jgi:hypothetical protein